MRVMMIKTKLFRVGTMRLGRAIIAALTILAPVNASAQALYGSLVGNVVDETGAVVTGATVAITQKETNQTREQATHDGELIDDTSGHGLNESRRVALRGHTCHSTMVVEPRSH
jgi:hypothetical protein